jgi:hypothetical protein
MTVQSIKRSLVKSRNYYTSSKEKGNKLDVRITEMMELNQMANILQIMGLIVFGLVWVKIVHRLKKSK